MSVTISIKFMILQLFLILLSAAAAAAAKSSRPSVEVGHTATLTKEINFAELNWPEFFLKKGPTNLLLDCESPNYADSGHKCTKLKEYGDKLTYKISKDKVTIDFENFTTADDEAEYSFDVVGQKQEQVYFKLKPGAAAKPSMPTEEVGHTATWTKQINFAELKWPGFALKKIINGTRKIPLDCISPTQDYLGPRCEKPLKYGDRLTYKISKDKITITIENFTTADGEAAYFFDVEEGELEQVYFKNKSETCSENWKGVCIALMIFIGILVGGIVAYKRQNIVAYYRWKYARCSSVAEETSNEERQAPQRANGTTDGEISRNQEEVPTEDGRETGSFQPNGPLSTQSLDADFQAGGISQQGQGRGSVRGKFRGRTRAAIKRL